MERQSDFDVFEDASEFFKMKGKATDILITPDQDMHLSWQRRSKRKWKLPILIRLSLL